MKNVMGGTVILSVGLLIAAFSTSVSAQKCLAYGPAPVTLTGTLHSRVYAGPPNWESMRRGDSKETALILKLDNTTCTTGDDPMGLDVSHVNLSEMQLVIRNDAEWKIVRNRMGKRVMLTGTLFGGHTGWHRTKVLIDVAHIRAVRSALTLPITYPAIWFAPIKDPNKPAWEILPQEAKPGEVILSKRNELGILSNFAATPFVLDGKRYASVEGFWQMMLYPSWQYDARFHEILDRSVVWKYSREQVAQMTGFEAKEAGRLAEENMKKLGINWCTYGHDKRFPGGKRFLYRSQKPGEHYRLIVAAMRAKLEQNAEVKRILLATGDLTLKPDHHGEENPPPEWKYYEIWMQLRAVLQQQTH